MKNALHLLTALALVTVSALAQSLPPTPAASSAPSAGTDGDGVPAGLSDEEADAWLWSHSSAIVVTP